MKPSRIQSRLVLFAFACLVALQMSPGLAAGGLGAGNQNHPVSLPAAWRGDQGIKDPDSDKRLRHRPACPR